MKYKTYIIVVNTILLILYNIAAFIYVISYDPQTLKFNSQLSLTTLIIIIVFIIVNILIKKHIYRHEYKKLYEIDVLPFIGKDERESQVIGDLLSKKLFAYLGAYTAMLGIIIFIIYSFLFNYYSVLNAQTLYPFVILSTTVIFDINVIIVFMSNTILKKKLNS